MGEKSSIYFLKTIRVWAECPVTARQYGEVVLPDAASGHDPDSLARKLSRCKEGMAWFLQIQVQVLSKPGVSRYKFYRSR